MDLISLVRKLDSDCSTSVGIEVKDSLGNELEVAELIDNVLVLTFSKPKEENRFKVSPSTIGFFIGDQE